LLAKIATETTRRLNSEVLAIAYDALALALAAQERLLGRFGHSISLDPSSDLSGVVAIRNQPLRDLHQIEDLSVVQA
jgi:hypothetical protein